MAAKCILFDFDNTISNTNSLKEIRDTHEYELLTGDVLAKIKLYKPVLGILQSLQADGVVMAIVTNSGSRYISRLLKHLEIEQFFQTVVTYTDVKAAGMKPSPIGIKLALTRLGIPASKDVLYVGDTNLDIEAAYCAGVTPVLPSWASKETTSLPPAVEMSSEQLCNFFKKPNEYSLFAERCADLGTAKFHREGVYFLPLDDNANVVTMEDEITTLCFGRYFAQKSSVSATLHDAHALSLEIVKKDAKPVFDIPQYWYDMLAHVVQKTGESKFCGRLPFDIVTVIPAKQGKDPRLERLLEGVEEILHKHAGSTVFDGSIYQYVADARSQKSLQRNERHREAGRSLHFSQHGAQRVNGKRVLIIDDVITTGATLQRARSLALEAGASSAIGVAIAKTVSIIQQERDCPACGRPMKINKAKGTGIRFWGCTGYQDEDDTCKYTESFYVKECPKCQRAMRLIANRQTNEKFWGCNGYLETPQCNYTCSFDPTDAN